MKKNKIVFVIVSCLFISNIFAQDINFLDEKKGFKDFTIGDSYAKWQNQIQLNSFDKQDSTYSYKYTGTCCQDVFNYSIEGIQLKFYKNKLVSIFIVTDFFQNGKPTWRTDDYMSINKSLSNLFGKESLINMDEKTGNATYTWQGQKVILMSMYDYSGFSGTRTIGDRQIISLVDYSYYKKSVKLNSGF